jgi:anti-sigma factor RsiW
MRCEEVQAYLALNTPDPDVQVAADSHLTDCSACRSTALLYARIDQTLKAQPAWEPPRHFTQRVIAQVPPVIPSSPHLSRSEVLGGVALGLLTIAVVWGIGYAVLQPMAGGVSSYEQWARDLTSAINANRAAVAWTSVALSLGVSAWFTRRSLR